MGSRENESAGSSLDFLSDQRLSNEDNKFTRSIIVGEDYQAEVPDFIDPSCVEHSSSEDDKETLLWAPSSQTDLTDSQVEGYLEYARTKAVKTSYNNTEHALHVLHQSRGDIHKSMLMLTSGSSPELPVGHPMLNYTYSECETWSEEETQKFCKSIQLHDKNFHKISKDVQTKTVGQCVQLYFLWKKRGSSKYHWVLPRKPKNKKKAAVVDPHNTRSSARRETAAAAQRAINLAAEAVQIGDTDASLPLHDSLSLPLHGSCLLTPSTNRVEEEMTCVDSSDGSVITERADTIQLASFESVPDCSVSSNCSTSNEESPTVNPILAYPCSFEDCRMCFSSKRGLQSHMNKHKKGSKSSPRTPSQRKVSDHSPTPCPMSDHTPPPCPVSDQPREAVFPCTKCDRVFAKIKSRNAHMKCHKTSQTPM